MKKIAMTCTVLGLCAPWMQTAQAQLNITIYGTADGGVRYLSHAGTNGGSKLYMGTNGWNSSNKLDIAGKEDIGGGMEAHFLLENGFNLATGALDNTNSALFSRQSYVGLKGALGSIDMGRQYTIAHDFISDYDPFHFHYTSLIPLTQASSGTRFSNDVKYVGKFGAFKFEVENSFGEVAGSVNDGSARGLGLQYYGTDIIAGASFNRRRVLAGTAYRNQDYYLAGVAYKMGNFGMSGGYMIDTINMQSTAPDTVTRNLFGGASYAFTSRLKLTGGFYRTTSSTDKARGKDMTIVGLDYKLSKRTTLYTEVDLTRYRSAIISSLNTTGANRQVGMTAGINHRF